MIEADPGVVVGVVAIVFGPILAWLASRRATSGRVDTSEAKELWSATQTFMEYQQREIIRLHEALVRCMEK